LRGAVKTPPFSQEARIEAGFLLRRLQRGESLGLPHSRPMTTIGPGCHELRIVDRDQTWRILYHVAPDSIVILEVFSKKTVATPKAVVAAARRRLQMFLALSAGKKDRDAKRQA
jgi:phage-related protein